MGNDVAAAEGPDSATGEEEPLKERDWRQRSGSENNRVRCFQDLRAPLSVSDC